MDLDQNEQIRGRGGQSTEGTLVNMLGRPVTGRESAALEIGVISSCKSTDNVCSELTGKSNGPESTKPGDIQACMILI